MHKEPLYLPEVFQATKIKFLDALDHIWNHPGSATEKGTNTLTNLKKKSKISIFSGFQIMRLS